LAVWKKLFGRDPSPKGVAGDRPVSNDYPELNAARAAHDAGRLDDAVELAREHVSSDNAHVVAEARMIMAAVHLEREENRVALELYQQVADVRDDRTSLTFVAVLSVLLDDVERGEAAFARVEELHKTGEDLHVPGDGRPVQLFNIAHARLHYAGALRDRGHLRLALAPLEGLRAWYEELEISDPTYLLHRGMPPLHRTMAVALDVFRGLGEDFDGAAWIAAFSERLDSDGREYLQGLRDSLRDGD